MLAAFLVIHMLGLQSTALTTAVGISTSIITWAPTRVSCKHASPPTIPPSKTPNVPTRRKSNKTEFTVCDRN